MRSLSAIAFLAAVAALPALSGCSLFGPEPGTYEYSERERRAAQTTGWRETLAKARREDHAAVAAQYPEFGWMSGIWCDPDGKAYVYKLQERNVLKILHHHAGNFFGETYLLRTRGDIVEAWGGTLHRDLDSGKTWHHISLIKFARTPDGAPVQISFTNYEPETVDLKVPFSGSGKHTSDKRIALRRCSGR